MLNDLGKEEEMLMALTPNYLLVSQVFLFLILESARIRDQLLLSHQLRS